MECLDRVRDRNFVSTEHSYLQLLSSGLETQQTEDRFSTTNESLEKKSLWFQYSSFPSGFAQQRQETRNMGTSRMRDWDVHFRVDKQVFLEALGNKKENE